MTPASRTPAAPPAPPLRERKKQRTRQTLIDTALTLFTRRGFGSVTLDELCAEVEVSKRTFFRYFTSKEDVALAPLHDVWRAYQGELAARLDALRATGDAADAVRTTGSDGPQTLLHLMRDALLAALDRTAADTDWTRRALLSHRLAERTPSMVAHGLHFCERTTGDVLELLHGALVLDGPDDPRPRFAGEMLLSAHRHALATWSARAGADPEPAPADVPDEAQLAALVRESVAALADGLALTATPRRTG
ncbi:TetR family transcriptional regulator [Streptomyces sp. Z26]|uniref:TetR family transcriptional regulator n=1 Tax=Streptomyces sp. Z26 TaxID=2500177 RepID=UPI000EF154FD|nr:TetR family transcriptional regulator [Streptomyces sp. Z26]RLL66889.1 TetR family transcriptional regulator [Streptomyces sp. Z26]